MHNLFALIKSTVEVLIRRVQNSYSRLLNCVTFYFFLVFCGRTCFLLWKMAKCWNSLHAAVTFLTCCISLQACASNLQCTYGTYAEYGTMLRNHVFQEHNAANVLACSLLCNSNIRCQSVNYVISRLFCELNSRTKEARPEDYVQDADRVYVTRSSERGIAFIPKFGTTRKFS